MTARVDQRGLPRAAMAGYIGHSQRVHPICFTCGNERGEGDGLRVTKTVEVLGYTLPASLTSQLAGASRARLLWYVWSSPAEWVAGIIEQLHRGEQGDVRLLLDRQHQRSSALLSQVLEHGDQDGSTHSGPQLKGERFGPRRFFGPSQR